MTERIYAKLFPAKMAAAKLTKKTGNKYIPVGPSAVDGTYTVVLDVPAKVRKSSAPEGGVFGSQIPCGKASYEEQIAALWKFAEISNDRKMVNYLTGMNEDYLKMVLGKSKTRWGAIGNVRAAMEAA